MLADVTMVTTSAILDTYHFVKQETRLGILDRYCSRQLFQILQCSTEIPIKSSLEREEG